GNNVYGVCASRFGEPDDCIYKNGDLKSAFCCSVTISCCAPKSINGFLLICPMKKALFYLSGADNIILANPHMIRDAVNIPSSGDFCLHILFQQPNSICFFLPNFNKIWNYVYISVYLQA
ncbi:hypothetical protein MKW92_006652, partial [Papaver armeniacum]